MFRIMMAGRSYANVPTSEGSDTLQPDHFPLQEVPKKPLEISTQNLPNGSTFNPYHKPVTSNMQKAPPPTPPRNSEYNRVIPPSQQVMTSLPPIPQSPALPPDNPYEELPSPPTNVSDVQLSAPDSIDGGDHRFSQPEADQYFMRLDSTMSATSTDGIIQDSYRERAPRKKKNPTYESSPFERPYVPQNNKFAKETEAKAPSHRCCSCDHLKTYFFIIFIFMLALLALLLVVLVISGVVGKEGAVAGGTAPIIGEPSTDDPSLSPEELQRQINQLGVAYQALLDRFVALEQQLGSGSANASISLRLARNTLQINEITNNLTAHSEDITELEKTVTIATTVAVQANTKAVEANEKIADEVLPSIQDLRHQHNNLSQVVTESNTQHSQQINALQDLTTQHNSQISALQSDVNIIESTFTNTVTSMNSSIYQELDTISKMSGPRGYNGSQGENGEPGPPGAGNLTACIARNYYGGGGFSTVTETDWLPHLANQEDIDNARGSVYTGVTCSTLGGVETYLETQTDTPTGIKQYKCKCGGRSTEIVNSSRLCYIHVWSCPSTS